MWPNARHRRNPPVVHSPSGQTMHSIRQVVSMLRLMYGDYKTTVVTCAVTLLIFEPAAFPITFFYFILVYCYVVTIKTGPNKNIYFKTCYCNKNNFFKVRWIFGFSLQNKPTKKKPGGIRLEPEVKLLCLDAKRKQRQWLTLSFFAVGLWVWARDRNSLYRHCVCDC